MGENNTKLNYVADTNHTRPETILTADTNARKFLVFWLDANVDETNKDFKKSIESLRRAVGQITISRNADECIQFIRTVKNKKIFLLISGTLGETTLPQIEPLTQLDSVYIFCYNKTYHEQWAKDFKKVKGIYTDMKSICESLRAEIRRCNRGSVSISFNGIDAFFMYSRLLKEALLAIEYDYDRSLKDLIDYCRDRNDFPEEEMESIECEYHYHTPISWCIAPHFIYSTLNQGLFEMNVDVIFKFGFLIQHLHNYIVKLHRKQMIDSQKVNTPFVVYRAQELSRECISKLRRAESNLISFNNFLSTSRNRDIALKHLAYVTTDSNRNDPIVLFVMHIDPEVCQKSDIPFIDVGNIECFEDQEDEILFTMHTVFRIEKINILQNQQNERQLWEVELTLTTINGNDDIDKLEMYVRDGFQGAKGWEQLALILIHMGNFARAERIYTLLLEKSYRNIRKATYYHQLGTIYANTGKYAEAIESYQKSIEIDRATLPVNHPDLAATYNNMGNAYRSMGEYSKALEFHQLSIEIRKVVPGPENIDLALSYSNMGNVYTKMCEFSMALEVYQQSLEICKNVLNPDYPELAMSYNNIGWLYYSMDKYSLAISHYEEARIIWNKSLPSNHPYLLQIINNIEAAKSKL